MTGCAGKAVWCLQRPAPHRGYRIKSGKSAVAVAEGVCEQWRRCWRRFQVPRLRSGKQVGVVTGCEGTVLLGVGLPHTAAHHRGYRIESGKSAVAVAEGVCEQWRRCWRRFQVPRLRSG